MKSSYAYLLAPILGYLVAQSIKYLLKSAQTRSWKDMLRSGNMPSSHSAVVMAPLTAILVHDGVTDVFAVLATVAMITIYDALVARRSIGEQGQALLRLIEKSPFAKDPLPRIALGHRPLEVAAGIAVGIMVGAIVAIFITK